MSVIAKLRYLRITPRKVRLVTDLIRGKTVEQAQHILNFTIKRTSGPLLKLLKSAIANAKNNFHLDEANLYISKILVDEGPKNKRFLARARGRADQIEKKSSHITIALDEIHLVKSSAKSGRISPKAKLFNRVKKPPSKVEKPKLKPKLEIKRPKIERGIKKVFRRKAF